MAKYLTNKATQAALEKIIIGAEKKLILISPYVKLTNLMFARFKVAAEKGVVIKIIYRANKVDKQELDRLKTIKNIELKSTDDLHAKCYFNEKEMIITSLNLLATSETNWEMGIHIDRVEDKELYDSALVDALTIFSDSKAISTISENIKFLKQDIKEPKRIYKSKLPSNGYCICCEKGIPFDPEKPLCKSCWRDLEDDGEFCHCCGSNTSTDYDKPLCYKCYKKHEDLLIV
jgi:hypothetical protein